MDLTNSATVLQFMFESPLRLINWMSAVLLLLVLYQLFMITRSHSWHQLLSVTGLLTFNYLILYRLFRDRWALQAVVRERTGTWAPKYRPTRSLKCGNVISYNGWYSGRHSVQQLSLCIHFHWQFFLRYRATIFYKGLLFQDNYVFGNIVLQIIWSSLWVKGRAEFGALCKGLKSRFGTICQS